MWWSWRVSFGDWTVGLRLRSWALPLLFTWTDYHFEVGVGPFYVNYEEGGHIPF